MKNLLSWKVLAGFVLPLIWAWPSAAQIQELRVNVPFAFTAGDQTHPAGAYVFTVDTIHLLSHIKISHGDHAGVIPVVAGGAERRASESNRAMLRFHKYGQQYVLAAVWKDSAAQGLAVADRPPREYGKAGSDAEFVDLR
jgi:hypothetical protein